MIEQKLYPLLPLQVFLLRGELKKYADEFDEKLGQEVDTVIESVFTTLEKKGIEKGRVEGRKEGIEEFKTAMAEKMILKDKPLVEIKEFSGLTEKKIRQLAKKLSKEIVLQ